MRTSKLAVKTPEAGAALNGLAKIMREYVAGSSDFPYLQLQRALPRHVDDAERDFGADIYERMLRDPMVAAAVDTLKMRALAEGLRLSPVSGGEDIWRFVESALESLDVPIEETLYDMLDALSFGHRLAEIVFEVSEQGRLVLRAIKPKPRRNYGFVLDAYQNLTGIAAIVPGKSAFVPVGIVPSPKDLPNLFPASKFFVLTFGGTNRDPRGCSLLRPAYNPWWLKQQTWPQLLKFLVQFAGPSLIGYTPENAAFSGDLSPEDVMLAALKGFQNGSIVVLRGGSKVDRIQSEGEGQAFLNAIELYNREITHAVLKQTRATMEALHGSRADSETASDILDVVVGWVQGVLARAFRRQVVRPLVALNFGLTAARDHCPNVLFKGSGKPDFAGTAAAVAQLQSSGYLSPSQYGGIDQLLSLPPR